MVVTEIDGAVLRRRGGGVMEVAAAYTGKRLVSYRPATTALPVQRRAWPAR